MCKVCLDVWSYDQHYAHVLPAVHLQTHLSVTLLPLPRHRSKHDACQGVQWHEQAQRPVQTPIHQSGGHGLHPESSNSQSTVLKLKHKQSLVVLPMNNYGKLLECNHEFLWLMMCCWWGKGGWKTFCVNVKNIVELFLFFPSGFWGREGEWEDAECSQRQ